MNPNFEYPKMLYLKGAGDAHRVVQNDIEEAAARKEGWRGIKQGEESPIEAEPMTLKHALHAGGETGSELHPGSYPVLRTSEVDSEKDDDDDGKKRRGRPPNPR